MTLPADDPDTEETLRLSGSPVAVIAPHGGDIEPWTDVQALALADRLDADAWVFRGFGETAFSDYHVTSTEVSPSRFPKLRRLYREGPYRLVVAFHGYGTDAFVVGGTAPLDLRESIAEAPVASPAAVVGEGAADGDHGSVAGDSPSNVVNRLSDGVGGVQLEQSHASRRDSRLAVVDTVADAVETHLP